MLAFSFLVAGSFSFGARIANLLEPTALMTVRFLLSGIVVGALAAAGPGFRREYFRGAWRYAVLGFLFATYFVLMFEGLKTASAVSTSAVFTLTPIMSAAVAYVLLRQRLTPWMTVALAVGACGALWVIFRADIDAMLRFEIGRGEAIFLVGCLAHAAYAPVSVRLNRGEPTIVFTFGMIVGALLLLLSVSSAELRSVNWTALPPVFWAGLVYLAVCASAMTFVLLQYASLRLPSAKVMAYTYLTPFWVAVWEVSLGGDIPAPKVLAGVCATVVALLMLLRTEGRT